MISNEESQIEGPGISFETFIDNVGKLKATPDLPTDIMDFRGFDSSII